MIRTLIIDDEPYCVTALDHDLKRYCPQIEVVATALSGKEGIAAIEQQRPELVFLDIEMPLMDGFELLEALNAADRRFQVIFTTAYDEFMLKAIRVNAMDYLLKPIDRTELVEAVNRTEKHLVHNVYQEDRIANLLNLIHPVENQRIALPNRDGYEFIGATDILYAKADGAYTLLVLVSGRTILLSKTLGEIESMLPERLFMRIHHSVVVNIKEISHFKKLKTSKVVLTNGEQLAVSRSRKDELLLRMRAR